MNYYYGYGYPGSDTRVVDLRLRIALSTPAEPLAIKSVPLTTHSGMARDISAARALFAAFYQLGRDERLPLVQPGR